MSPPSTPIAIASSSADPSATRGTGRASLRIIGLIGWTVAWYLGLLAGMVGLLPFRRRRAGFRRWVFRSWAGGSIRLLGVRVQVDGTVPRTPFVLVSNHLSYLDIVVFGALTGTRFVAKREVARWPGIGRLAQSTGTIFIDRALKRDAVRVLDDLDGAVGMADGITIFAEATSTAGETVLPFRPALLEWAARTGHPVHYASLSYRTPPGSAPAHLAVCWWGDMTFGDHFVGLCRLPAIEARVRFGAEPIEDRDRKVLAGRLHQAVTAQFTPVVTE